MFRGCPFAVRQQPSSLFQQGNLRWIQLLPHRAATVEVHVHWRFVGLSQDVPEVLSSKPQCAFEEQVRPQPRACSVD